MAKNLYKVPKRQWRKWPDLSQRMFNSMYYILKNNQRIMTHPDTVKIPKKQWKTVAWNAAWMAADETKTSLKEIAKS